MSLYHMMNGVNPCTFFVLPVFGKHPDSFPRFRDCNLYMDEENNRKVIQILTRTGGGNREHYAEGNEKMKLLPGFINDEDAEWDCTYAIWEYKVPEEWKEDVDKFINGKIKEFSQAYKDRLYEVYPKLSDTFDKLFNESEEEDAN